MPLDTLQEQQSDKAPQLQLSLLVQLPASLYHVKGLNYRAII